MLLVNEEEGEAGGYVSNQLSRFGHAPDQVDALVAAVEAKYGRDPPFASGWMTATQRTVLFAQCKAFLKQVGADRPAATAKSVLEGMDRTPARRAAFKAGDTDEDCRLSIAEARALFRRDPRVRKRLFLAHGDDKLHNISKKDAAEFSLLKYDQDDDFFVSEREFLFDDVALRDAITEKLVEAHLPNSVAKWLAYARDPRRGAVEAGMDGDALGGGKVTTNYEQRKAEEAKKQRDADQRERTNFLAEEVSSFYDAVGLPEKKSGAWKTAKRWADEPGRLHAALLKRYFKDSLHEWWPWLRKGRWFPTKEEREKEEQERREQARYERGGMGGGGPGGGGPGGAGGGGPGGPGGGGPMMGGGGMLRL